MSLKIEKDIKKERFDGDDRKAPISFLPEEPMIYEIKKKKKKKKKKQEDPFKDLEDSKPHLYIPPIPTLALDPEVNIKVEHIEVELDFNDVSNQIIKL